MSDLFERVRRHWQKEDAGIAAATATPQEINLWEQRYKVSMPDDLRAYVSQLNGTFNAEAFQFGEGLTSFFPLKAIVPEHDFDERFQNPNMFIFADYLISCYWYCAEVTAEKRERTRIFISAKQPKLVADSIEEFLEAYMAGSKRIEL